LKGLINKYEETPWKVINYLGATINYGGRVTQNLDKRLCRNILINYMNPKAIVDHYKYSKSGLYKVIPAGKHADYVNYLQSLPLNTLPEVFGLHDNAEISNA
jgi:dynein heavy chain